MGIGFGSDPGIQEITGTGGIVITNAFGPVTNVDGSALYGPILQITGSGGTVITNAYGPITDVYSPPGGAGACATNVAAGTVEMATQAEVLAGTAIGGTGCSLAVDPSLMIFREEIATGAFFANFSAPVAVAAGFGAGALDIQPVRNNAANIAAAGASICLGNDNRCTYGGFTTAIGVNNIGDGSHSIAAGSNNSALSDRSTAVGYRNTAGVLFSGYEAPQTFGRSNFALNSGSIAIGIMNNVYATANLNYATGAIAGDPQGNCPYTGINSLAVGHINLAYDLRGVCVGFGNVAGGPFYGPSAYGSVAMGLFNHVGGGVAYPPVAFGAYNNVYAENVAVGIHNTSNAYFGSALGVYNYALNDRASAVGYGNYASGYESVSLGRSNFTDTYSCAAVGVMNNVYTPGNLNDATGVIGGDPQAVAAYIGINSSALGVGNNAQGLRSSAIGFKSIAEAQGSTAIGDRAHNRVAETTNIAGAIIVRRDSGEALADAHRVFAGAEDIILTDEIDLTAVADHTITLPANCHFWWDECGIILTELTGIITNQPTVRFGINGTPAKYQGATLTTLLTAVLKRERFWMQLGADDGETSLLFGVTVAAVVGTSMHGRAYFKGMLVEDE